MNPNNPNTTFKALGLAGQAGILAVVMAVGSLLLGLLLDQVLGTKRTWALICVVASVPINLFVTLRITQSLIARVIPPDAQPAADGSTGSPSASSTPVDQADQDD
jgi:magnesium-transporting ATPase (P-type)